MLLDLTGIENKLEYYSDHYFYTLFEQDALESIAAWKAKSAQIKTFRAPWDRLKNLRSTFLSALTKAFDPLELKIKIAELATKYLRALGYPEAAFEIYPITNNLSIPIFRKFNKVSGEALLWVILAADFESDGDIMEARAFLPSDNNPQGDDDTYQIITQSEVSNDFLAVKALYGHDYPPRWLMFIGRNSLALIDRQKFNDKRYLLFNLEAIFNREEEKNLQAVSVLLHFESLCPVEGTVIHDRFEENSRRHAFEVSQDLKFSLRECVELIGNEVLYDLRTRLGRNFNKEPIEPSELTVQCLRYMYRILFIFFIEARPKLALTQLKAPVYLSGYSLESLREITENLDQEVKRSPKVTEGFYLCESLNKLSDLIYNGYPQNEEDYKLCTEENYSVQDVFVIEPLKTHIFDPERIPLIAKARLRNGVLLKVIELMSLARRDNGGKKRRGRISYATLGVNQLGAVYEALLSYSGFIAPIKLYEVKRREEQYDQLEVGYFVSEDELKYYDDEERVRFESGENQGELRYYEKGSFIYRLAGRDRENSASFYTPEVLTRCLVKYALKELLKDKSAYEILELKICEPAMGSAAFLNEAVNQLAEAYLDLKQKERGGDLTIKRDSDELQMVKMFIADRNVYGIDLNPLATELAEISLWLNTIYKKSSIPWFGTQLVCGNSLIGARRECFTIEELTSTESHWYESAPKRLEP
ncbi:MAG: class I SAM-dependent DNA methyltransferase, partial [Deltaproteobacteria bacterium]|nr:class I SAM-dependent DNA methyltransferase [Deltaproteobacteria bacterium]